MRITSWIAQTFDSGRIGCQQEDGTFVDASGRFQPLCENFHDPFHWLPAWRWADVVDLWAGINDGDGNILERVFWLARNPLSNAIQAVFNWITDALFWLSSLLWNITLAFVRIALDQSVDYARSFMDEMEEISAHLVGAIFSDVGVSLFGAVTAIGAFVGLYIAWRRGTRAGVRSLARTLIPLGALVFMVSQMSAHAQESVNKGAKGIAVPPRVGTPKWLFEESRDLADLFASDLVKAFDPISQKPVPQRTYCDTYTTALEDMFTAAYIEGSNNPERDRTRATLPIMVSRLWQQTGQLAWGAAQFGSSNAAQKGGCLASEANAEHIKAIETQAVWDLTCYYADPGSSKVVLYGCDNNRIYNQQAWDIAQGRFKANPSDVDAERTRLILSLACEFSNHNNVRGANEGISSPYKSGANEIRLPSPFGSDNDLLLWSDGKRWVWVDRQWVGVAGNAGTGFNNYISANECSQWISGAKAGEVPPISDSPGSVFTDPTSNGQNMADQQKGAPLCERMLPSPVDENGKRVPIFPSPHEVVQTGNIAVPASMMKSGACRVTGGSSSFVVDGEGESYLLVARLLGAADGGIPPREHQIVLDGDDGAEVQKYITNKTDVIQQVNGVGIGLYRVDAIHVPAAKTHPHCVNTQRQVRGSLPALSYVALVGNNYEIPNTVGGIVVAYHLADDMSSDCGIAIGGRFGQTTGASTSKITEKDFALQIGDGLNGVNAGDNPPNQFIANVFGNTKGVSYNCDDNTPDCLQNSADVTPSDIQGHPGRMIQAFVEADPNIRDRYLPSGEEVNKVVKTVHDIHGASKFGRLFKGVFALLTAVVYMITLIGLSMGLVLAQLILALVFTCLPFLLLVFAIPTESARHFPKKILKVTLGALLGTAVFSLLLSLLILVVYTLSTVVEAIDISSRNDYVHLVVLMAIPLAAIKLLGMGSKQFGLDISSLRGSVAATAGLAYANMSAPSPSSLYAQERNRARQGINRYRQLDRKIGGPQSGPVNKGGALAAAAAGLGAGAGAASAANPGGLHSAAGSVPSKGTGGSFNQASGSANGKGIGGALKSAAQGFNSTARKIGAAGDQVAPAGNRATRVLKGIRRHKKKIAAGAILAGGIPAAVALPGLLGAKGAGMLTRRFTRPFGLTRSEEEIKAETFTARQRGLGAVKEIFSTGTKRAQEQAYKFNAPKADENLVQSLMNSPSDDPNWFDSDWRAQLAAASSGADSDREGIRSAVLDAEKTKLRAQGESYVKQSTKPSSHADLLRQETEEDEMINQYKENLRTSTANAETKVLPPRPDK